MQRQGCVYRLFAGLILLPTVVAFGQRQELSISPVGLIHPKTQMVQYEHYVDLRQSLTASISYNGEQLFQFRPNRMTDFSSTRAAIGYRYYVPVLGEDLTIFGSARAVVDYSSLQLQTDSRFNIPSDSLRASGISLAPEILFGGKITLYKRITLSGAVGFQYLFKLYSTDQITHNQTYWSKVMSEDSENWQVNRNQIINYRRGRSPSIQVTVGVILGKRR